MAAIAWNDMVWCDTCQSYEWTERRLVVGFRSEPELSVTTIQPPGFKLVVHAALIADRATSVCCYSDESTYKMLMQLKSS